WGAITAPGGRSRDIAQRSSTAPLAIHAPSNGVPPAIRRRNAGKGSFVHTSGMGLLNLPLNFASPVALSGTAGVSTIAEFPPVPLTLQTNVPMTSGIPAVVPIGRPVIASALTLPAASTNPLTSNCTWPLLRLTLAPPDCVDQGAP